MLPSNTMLPKERSPITLEGNCPLLNATHKVF